MIAFFDFDLPRAVTEQLIERLDGMESSQLTASALRGIAEFQQQHNIVQGVYQVLLRDEVMYVGKARDVRERLEQHWNKLRGRKNVDVNEMRFKAFLLHGNWATSANEGLLIARYRQIGQCKWNGAGFGPKDVGQPRDTTKPNKFDSQYPINEEWTIESVGDRETLGSLLEKIKREVPYVFRYEVAGNLRSQAVDLTGVPRTSKALITKAASVLGRDWQATLLKSHVILYQESRDYAFGARLWPT